MEASNKSYTVGLDFEVIKLPPVSDILVLGRKHPQGKIGVMESFKFIAPDEFTMIEIGPEVPDVEAIMVNKKILKRIPGEEIIKILSHNVFPYMSKGEAVKVNFSVTMHMTAIKGTITE